jgi:hypothetical protein
VMTVTETGVTVGDYSRIKDEAVRQVRRVRPYPSYLSFY